MFSETIELLAARWSSAGTLLPGFGLLARGEALAIAELAEETGTEIDALRELLASVRCQLDEKGRLVDLFGMTLAPTPHRLEIEGNVVFACCALWAHVIPKLINGTVEVRSTDPVSNELVRLSISPGGFESLAPDGAVATMAVSDAGEIAADVCAAFCCHVRHFVTRDNALAFAAKSSRRRVVTVGDLHSLAQELYRSIWLRTRRTVPRELGD